MDTCCNLLSSGELVAIGLEHCCNDTPIVPRDWLSKLDLAV